jgi:hypothetical protein
VNSKAENFCLEFVQEFGLGRAQRMAGKELMYLNPTVHYYTTENTYFLLFCNLSPILGGSKAEGFGSGYFKIVLL